MSRNEKAPLIGAFIVYNYHNFYLNKILFMKYMIVITGGIEKINNPFCKVSAVSGVGASFKTPTITIADKNNNNVQNTTKTTLMNCFGVNNKLAFTKPRIILILLIELRLFPDVYVNTIISQYSYKIFFRKIKTLLHYLFSYSTYH